jgi:hypothetical protein
LHGWAVCILPLSVACGSEVYELSAITDIRIHDLRAAVRGAPMLPGSTEEVHQLLPPGRRDELGRDEYGSPIRYSVQGLRYELRSAGEDQVMNTADDYVLADSAGAGGTPRL